MRQGRVFPPFLRLGRQHPVRQGEVLTRGRPAHYDNGRQSTSVAASTQFRPEALARYIAESAAAISGSASILLDDNALPILTVTGSLA